MPLLVFFAALVLGGWPRISALDAGFWSDDYLQNAMLQSAYPRPRSAFDLFRFSGGGRAETAALTSYGYYPWWTHDDFRLSMMRPLPSALHALDYALFGGDARAHHLHTFAWWALCIAAVSALFFAALPRTVAAASTLLFAMDESHSVPLVWIANRSPLMALAFGAAALAAHLRFRETGSVLSRAVALTLFALALQCGEYALPMLGYAICLELFAPGAGASRARAVAPFAALAALFVIANVALGHGAAHSGFYTSPFTDPIGYARKVLHGVPVLAGDLVLGVPADHYTFGSPWPLFMGPNRHAVQIGMGLFALVCGGWLLARLRRRAGPDHAEALLWLTAGSVLALLPVLSSFITTRLVLPASIGCAALLGSALCAGVSALRNIKAPGTRASAALAPAAIGLLVLYVHGYGAARDGAATTALYSQIARARTAIPLGADIHDAAVPGQRIVVVSAADVNDAPYLPYVRFGHGRPLAGGFRLLSGAASAHEVRRVDARTIELRVLDPNVLPRSIVGSLTRADDDPLRVGQRFALPGLTVEVLALHERQPVRMRYTFDVPLEDESLLWLESGPRGLRRLSLPQVGASAVLPAPVLPEIAAMLPQ